MRLCLSNSIIRFIQSTISINGPSLIQMLKWTGQLQRQGFIALNPAISITPYPDRWHGPLNWSSQSYVDSRSIASFHNLFVNKVARTYVLLAPTYVRYIYFINNVRTYIFINAITYVYLIFDFITATGQPNTRTPPQPCCAIIVPEHASN